MKIINFQDNSNPKIIKANPDLIKGKDFFYDISEILSDEIPKEILDEGIRKCIDKDFGKLNNYLSCSFVTQNKQWYFYLQFHNIQLIESNSSKFNTAIKYATRLDVSVFKFNEFGVVPGCALPDKTYHVGTDQLTLLNVVEVA